MARFKVREVFRISKHPSVVIAGDVSEGAVKPGMYVLIELQPGLTFSCEIAEIDYVDRVGTGESLVALRCKEDENDQAILYADLLPPGTVIEVVDGDRV